MAGRDAEGCNGKINLKIARRDDNVVSYVAEQYYKLPLQVMTPFYPDEDGMVSVYLLNPSGGVMEYDNFMIDIQQEANTHAQIRTPSANKVYRRKGNGVAHQKNRFSVGEGSTLEYLPDEMIPYRNSAYSQETEIYLKKDARLITWDIMAAGRAANGEHFAFDEYLSQIRIYMENQLLLCDRMKLFPSKQDMQSLLCMNSYLFLATVYAYTTQEDTEILIQQIQSLEQRDTDGIIGVSSPADGLIVVKLMHQHMYKLQQELQNVWSILRSGILHKKITTARKY